ncbi:MAG: enoyl-CoA hydratase/isomerase family protein [Solirubrobacteraceae bacterium]|nr:enoyl-CoA hydratase/isomerase family protein [Solirubrobacteraceae bacterium]
MVLERPSEGVAALRINRPEVRGALDRASLQQMIAYLSELEAEDGLAALVLSSTDPTALCAGADVNEVLDHKGGVERMHEFSAVYTALEAFPAVTICAMVGNTVGAGAEMAAACDLRVAGDNLKLRWVGGLLGVPVGPGRLTPLVGLAAARHLVFASPVVGPEEALRLNLTFDVVPAADAHDRAVEIGTQLASRPVPNVRRIKSMFREFEETERRTLKENQLLMNFQRHSTGLPSGGARR